MCISTMLGSVAELICRQSSSTDEGQYWSMLNEASCLGAMDRKPIACMKVAIMKLTSIPTHPHTACDLKLFLDGCRTQSAETVSIDRQNMHVG
jgi:hypothetical protein